MTDLKYIGWTPIILSVDLLIRMKFKLLPFDHHKLSYNVLNFTFCGRCGNVIKKRLDNHNLLEFCKIEVNYQLNNEIKNKSAVIKAINVLLNNIDDLKLLIKEN